MRVNTNGNFVMEILIVNRTTLKIYESVATYNIYT